MAEEEHLGVARRCASHAVRVHREGNQCGEAASTAHRLVHGKELRFPGAWRQQSVEGSFYRTRPCRFTSHAGGECAIRLTALTVSKYADEPVPASWVPAGEEEILVLWLPSGSLCVTIFIRGQLNPRLQFEAFPGGVPDHK